ncbi:protein Dhp61 [Bacillus sp. C1]
MKDDYTSYAILEQIERFDYITIDLENKFFYIEVVDIKTNKVLLGVSINFKKDTTTVNGDIEKYHTLQINDLLTGFKTTAQMCIDNNLRHADELWAFIENN